MCVLASVLFLLSIRYVRFPKKNSSSHIGYCLIRNSDFLRSTQKSFVSIIAFQKKTVLSINILFSKKMLDRSIRECLQFCFNLYRFLAKFPIKSIHIIPYIVSQNKSFEKENSHSFVFVIMLLLLLFWIVIDPWYSKKKK